MTGESMPRRKSRIQVHTSEAESVLTDSTTGRVYRLNPTAFAIWELCDGETLFEEVVEILSHLTSSDRTKIRQDVAKTLDELDQLELLD